MFYYVEPVVSGQHVSFFQVWRHLVLCMQQLIDEEGEVGGMCSGTTPFAMLWLLLIGGHYKLDTIISPAVGHPSFIDMTGEDVLCPALYNLLHNTTTITVAHLLFLSSCFYRRLAGRLADVVDGQRRKLVGQRVRLGRTTGARYVAQLSVPPSRWTGKTELFFFHFPPFGRFLLLFVLDWFRDCGIFNVIFKRWCNTLKGQMNCSYCWICEEGGGEIFFVIISQNLVWRLTWNFLRNETKRFPERSPWSSPFW